MTIACVDDEKYARKLIRNLVSILTPEHTFIWEAASLNEGLQKMKEQKPDLLLLDIQLPDGNGFDLLDKIYHSDLSVVFITAYDNFATRAFRYNAADYILKPINPDIFSKTIETIAQKPNYNNQLNAGIQPLLEAFKAREFKRIIIPSEDAYDIVNVENIIRMEVSGNYTNIIIEDNDNILAIKSLRELEEVLPEQFFHRVHQSHLVSMRHVSKVIKSEGGSIKMLDGSIVPIARRRKDDFLKKLFRLL